MSPSESKSPACKNHLTVDERKVYERRRRVVVRAYEKRQREVREFDPACWAWPIPALRVDAELRVTAPASFPHGDVEAERKREQFEDFHDDRCAICGYGAQRLVVDHCHRTGRVRGLLCHDCNIKEGLDAWPGSAFDRYAERNPGTILDYVAQYVNPKTRREEWGERELDDDERAEVWAAVRRADM